MKDTEARRKLDHAEGIRISLRDDLTTLAQDVKQVRADIEAALGSAYKRAARASWLPWLTSKPTVDDRLTALEDKLDALMDHLDIRTEVPDAAPAFVVLAGAEEDE